jgi:NADP-dependent 3-hydroxy acid dehydrogenase YdfG
VTRLAVVTGAGGSIGGAIAEALAELGHELILVGRRKERVASLLARYPGRFLSSDLAAVRDLQRACRELGELDAVSVMVHAAGRFETGMTADFPADQLDELYHVNVRAPYCLTQALLPALRAARGQLVFVNSSVGVRPPRASVGAYAATKHALRAIADAVRAEENENGVRVLSVYPGRTAGPLQERIQGTEAQPYDAARLLQPTDLAAAVVSALSLPRTAEVTDVHIRPMLKPVR